MTLGEKIRDLRKSVGFSQAVLADRTRIKQESISRFEGGVRKPSHSQLKKIAEALGVSLAELNVDSEYLTSQVLSEVAGMADSELEKVLEYIGFIKYLRGKNV